MRKQNRVYLYLVMLWLNEPWWLFTYIENVHAWLGQLKTGGSKFMFLYSNLQWSLINYHNHKLELEQAHAIKVDNWYKRKYKEVAYITSANLVYTSAIYGNLPLSSLVTVAQEHQMYLNRICYRCSLYHNIIEY